MPFFEDSERCPEILNYTLIYNSKKKKKKKKMTTTITATKILKLKIRFKIRIHPGDVMVSFLKVGKNY